MSWTSSRSNLASPLGWLVSFHGLFIVATILFDQIHFHGLTHIRDLTIDLPLVIGMSLLYLGTVLRRQKRTAWLVAVLAYTFYLGLNVEDLITRPGFHSALAIIISRSFVLPLLILALLAYSRNYFTVRSDVQNFRRSMRLALTILLIAFCYGTVGFSLFDKSDFHQEIGVVDAMHYTVDRFDLTTVRPIQPDTKRAHLFVDSLTAVSLAALGYAALSLFQPLRARFSDQRHGRELMRQLLEQEHADSEEFFKLWPHDKQYFFNQAKTAGLAFHVSRRSALLLSDPIGPKAAIEPLLRDFATICHGNDWQPTLVHVGPKYLSLYQRLGYETQLLGKEAILDLQHFTTKVLPQKYFRQLQNRAKRHNLQCELLKPPHNEAVIGRLRQVSTEWLSRDGRQERGFVMGYFSEAYLQHCDLMVLRDAAGTIQAFLNQVPASFDTQEATYDMLRQTNDAPGNAADILLIGFIEYLQQAGYQRLNLGLCPLVGVDESDDDSVVNTVLRFAYVNGDRFYSFSGLQRFKEKYEPEWHDRYFVYQGGVRGFSQAMTALLRTMRVKS